VNHNHELEELLIATITVRAAQCNPEDPVWRNATFKSLITRKGRIFGLEPASS